MKNAHGSSHTPFKMWDCGTAWHRTSTPVRFWLFGGLAHIDRVREDPGARLARHVQPYLDAIDAGLVDGDFEVRSLALGDRLTVADQFESAGERRRGVHPQPGCQGNFATD